MNWSGGKDSTLALYHTLLRKDIEVKYLLTTVVEDSGEVAMHRISPELLHRQAAELNIELIELPLPEMPDNAVYEKRLTETNQKLIDEGVTHSIFGDLYLEDLKTYREERLKSVGMNGVFPLWKMPTREVAESFFDLSFQAVVVCVDGSKLDASFCGRNYDRAFIKDLPDGVDVCGENGEFHTFVTAAPMFKKNISVQTTDILTRTFPSPATNTSSTFHYAKIIASYN